MSKGSVGTRSASASDNKKSTAVNSEKKEAVKVVASKTASPTATKTTTEKKPEKKPSVNKEAKEKTNIKNAYDAVFQVYDKDYVGSEGFLHSYESRGGTTSGLDGNVSAVSFELKGNKYVASTYTIGKRGGEKKTKGGDYKADKALEILNKLSTSEKKRLGNITLTNKYLDPYY